MNENSKCFDTEEYIPKIRTNSTTVRIRPMDNVKLSQDRFGGKHLAAIGSGSGTIQLVDVFTGKLEKELNVHYYCAVKCLEWIGPDMIISAAYSNSISANGSVRNDIVLTNILTGAKKRLRPEADESPVRILRTSAYQRYLAIAFRNDPLEIWDLHSHRLLRRMSKKCPIIVDMAWSGKNVTKKSTNQPQIIREHLVVLDNENHLYHVVVKGLHVRDGKEVNTLWRSGSPPIICMSWKDDILAFGDVNGNLRIWDLQKKTYNQINSTTLNGPIIRCAFSQLFGDDTIAIQYARGVVIFDALCLKQLSDMLFPESTLVDMDMFGATPVCILNGGIFKFAL